MVTLSKIESCAVPGQSVWQTLAFTSLNSKIYALYKHIRFSMVRQRTCVNSRNSNYCIRFSIDKLKSQNNSFHSSIVSEIDHPVSTLFKKLANNSILILNVKICWTKWIEHTPSQLVNMVSEVQNKIVTYFLFVLFTFLFSF